MNVIPTPKKITPRRGTFSFLPEMAIRFSSGYSGSLDYFVGLLAAEIEAACGFPCQLNPIKSSAPSGGLVIRTADGHRDQGYRLDIGATGIKLEASDADGLIHGIQTLRQLVVPETGTVPCMSIRDWPDFAARGFYHDVTRGKVPTLKTLMALADKMASYKLNQLQLYVEHTFAFKNHPDIWEGSDPLTAKEIRALDAHCEHLNIDLVPSLSTFGHFYMALRSRRKEHLNELDIRASEIPYSLLDRMNHYTLDCSNPESLELVAELIGEFLPLFRSRYFNICCDETFDLGKGKNAGRMSALGEGHLYTTFLKKVMGEVMRHGKTPMFWGDVLIKHPELMKQLPAGVIALNWDYAPLPKRSPCGPFQKAGVRFYACPGVHGWNRFLNHIPDASKNIINYTAQGKKFGAEGILNTDWGDCGHVNLLAGSYHGMILGAAASWNLRAATDTTSFDSALDEREFGDASGRTCALLREAAAATSVDWEIISCWFDPSPDLASWEKDTKTGFFVAPLKKDSRIYLASYRSLVKLRRELTGIATRAVPRDPLAYRELICALDGSALMHAVVLLLQSVSGYSKRKPGLSFYKIADAMRSFEQEFSDLWHLRNKPSEYWRLKTVFIGIARRLDALSKE